MYFVLNIKTKLNNLTVKINERINYYTIILGFALDRSLIFSPQQYSKKKLNTIQISQR